jgi:hypothetical protein
MTPPATAGFFVGGWEQLFGDVLVEVVSYQPSAIRNVKQHHVFLTAES